MISEQGSLWLKVLQAKYGDSTHSLVAKNANKGSRWWRDLMKVCVGEVDLFATNVNIKVGEGGNTLFWHGRRA